MASRSMDGLDPTEADQLTTVPSVQHLRNAMGEPFGMEGPIPAYAGIFDIFKIGLGPSSSHTNGPLNIAATFVKRPIVQKAITDLSSDSWTKETPCDKLRVKVDLYGSLSSTGVGHGTHNAILVGFRGDRCNLVDDRDVPIVREIVDNHTALNLDHKIWIKFEYENDMIWNEETWKQHPNGMRITLLNGDGDELDKEDYLSLGGGFFVTIDEHAEGKDGTPPPKYHPYPFASWEELVDMSEKNGLTIPELMYLNEMAEDQTRGEVYNRIDETISVMFECINKGVSTSGPLPLRGMRRASREQYLKLTMKGATCHCSDDSLRAMDFVSVYARAVNEENACGCKVVTAPTNGACGVIPSVMAYYWNFMSGSNKQGLRDFIATAAAIGSLIKRNASISGAEAGCQAEVGSAIAMAAAALAYVSGGGTAEVGYAAETGIEHSLGLTCDPVAGVVVIPCIDRNALGATKAIMCARMALIGAEQTLALDCVIQTMFVTGVDIQSKYRETSKGGLAILGESPTHKAFTPDYAPMAENSRACTGCNCELEDGEEGDTDDIRSGILSSCKKGCWDLGRSNSILEQLAKEADFDEDPELKQKVEEMVEQTREIQASEMSKVAQAYRNAGLEVPEVSRDICQECIGKEISLKSTIEILKKERGIPEAVKYVA